MFNQEREGGQPKLPHESEIFNLSISHVLHALQKQHAEKQQQQPQQHQQNDQEQEKLQKSELDKFKLQQQSELKHSKQLETKHSPEWLQSKEQQNQNYQHNKQDEKSRLSQSDKFEDKIQQYMQNQNKAQQQRSSWPLPSQNESIQNLNQQPIVPHPLQNEFIQIFHQQYRLNLLQQSKSQLRNKTRLQTSQSELFLQFQPLTKYLQELFRSQLEQLQLRHSKEILEKGHRHKQEMEHLTILQNRIRELQEPLMLPLGQIHQEKLREFQRNNLHNLHIKQRDELENQHAQEFQKEMQNQLRLIETQHEIYEFMKNKLNDGVQMNI